MNDGFIWNRLTLSPENDATTLYSLQLHLDFNPGQCLYLERYGVYEEKKNPMQVMPESADWGFSCSLWKNDNPAVSADPEVKVSTYVDPTDPKRGIIVVGNLGDEHKITDLTLVCPGWEQVGKLRDISNNCTVDVENGKATFPITALNFRLLTPEF